MYQVQQTQGFVEWLAALRDMKAKARIIGRIRQAEHGNLGDTKFLGEGISEMRIAVGPGYRLYYMKRRGVLIILLAGGDKATQQRDIKRAQLLAQRLKGD